MKDRPTLCPIAASVGIVAVLVMAIADIANAEQVYRGGLILLTLASVGIVWRRSAVAAEVLEHVRQLAYDEGYSDGTEARAPVLQLHRAVSGDSTAKQLR